MVKAENNTKLEVREFKEVSSTRFSVFNSDRFFWRACMHINRLDDKKTRSQFGKSTVANDERVTELQRKLEEKISERKMQAEALKILPQRNIAKASKNSFEEQHWKELEQSRERQAQLLQHGVGPRGTASRISTYQAIKSRNSPACLLQS